MIARFSTRRYVLVPWGDIAPSDLWPANDGQIEVEISYRHEQHLGIYVRGQYGVELGMLGLRCEVVRGELMPLGIAISDGALDLETQPVPVQSNPRRAQADGDDGA